MKLLGRLEKNRTFWLFLLAAVAFFLLRLPSLFEPYWYGDEGIYQTIGKGVSQGRLLYKEAWDNKPPLLYVLYALLGSDQFAVRTISLFAGLGSVASFFFLAQKIFAHSKKEVLILAAAIAFTVLLATPIIEGNIANAENFMMLPILLAALAVFTYKELPHPKLLLIAGALVGFAFLFKTVAIFDFAAFFFFLFFITYKDIRHVTSQFTLLLPYPAAFITPLVLVGGILYLQGVFSDFYKAAFGQMVGYVSYGNAFVIPQGLLIMKLLLLMASVILLFQKRKNIFPHHLFIFLWISFSTFNAFFAARPYTHYLLVLLPSFVLMGALLFTKMHTRLHRGMVALIIVLVMLIAKDFSLYSKTASYYQNFINFVTHRVSLEAYQRFFDANTPKDYKLAQFIKPRTVSSDTIFVWGNNAQLYTLADRLPPGRYAVAYHISATEKALEETKQALMQKKPKFIIVTSVKNPLPFSLSGYQQRLTIQDAIIYERSF